MYPIWAMFSGNLPRQWIVCFRCGTHVPSCSLSQYGQLKAAHTRGSRLHTTLPLSREIFRFVGECSCIPPFSVFIIRSKSVQCIVACCNNSKRQYCRQRRNGDSRKYIEQSSRCHHLIQFANIIFDTTLQLKQDENFLSYKSLVQGSTNYSLTKNICVICYFVHLPNLLQSLTWSKVYINVWYYKVSNPLNDFIRLHTLVMLKSSVYFLLSRITQGRRYKFDMARCANTKN